MQEKDLTILDFDDAAELARKDPEAFEQYRLDAIETMIAKTPEQCQQNLRRLQWRIDQTRERSPNATSATVKLYQMMWESFAGQGGLVDTLHNVRNSTQSTKSTLPRARLLSFSRTDKTKGS